MKTKSIEELVSEYRKISEILSSDQPLSGAEVEKLEQRRREIVREFWDRGLVRGGWVGEKG